MRCRRCLGTRFVPATARDMTHIEVRCPVCQGRGSEPPKRWEPASPPRKAHFSGLADMKIAQKEHDEFMAWLDEENTKHEWYRQAAERAAEQRAGFVAGE